MKIIVLGCKLPSGARDLYNAVDRRTDGGVKFKMIFDVYYLCLMLGLDKGRQGSIDKLEADEFLKDNYPDAYADSGMLITALLIDAELRRKEITPEDKKRTEQLMIRLLDPNSSTKLAPSGIELLNLYAVTGMDIIMQSIGKQHRELEELLLHYFNLLNPEVTIS